MNVHASSHIIGVWALGSCGRLQSEQCCDEFGQRFLNSRCGSQSKDGTPLYVVARFWTSGRFEVRAIGV
jgi:hypothetical protein